MQQINLYQQQFRKKKKSLTASSILTLLALFVVAMVVLQIKNVNELKPLQAKQAELDTKIQELTTQVAVAEQAAKPKPVDKLLEKEVGQLVSRLQHNEKLLKALTEGAMSNTTGFSEYFEAIANRHVDGTWITNMQIGNGGFRFSFSGKSLTPELVPVYLENLSDEQVFDNFSFNVLEMERTDQEAGIIDFNISTGSG